MKLLLLSIFIFFICTGKLSAQAAAVSTELLEITFSAKGYVNNYVKAEVEAWQKRGRYEPSNIYLARVTEEKRDSLIKKLEAEAIGELKRKIAKSTNWNQLEIADYDPDNGTFLIRSETFGDFLLPVAYTEAEAFGNGFASTLKSNHDFYFTSDGKIKLNQLTFTTNSGKQYTYNSNDPARFNPVVVDVDFGEINTDVRYREGREPDIAQAKTINIGSSDVDINIPETPQTNDKTFVVIIANEDYENEVAVKYAANDGKIFREYCKKTLGIPEKNIRYKTNATFGNMWTAITDICEIMKAYRGQAKVIFYYAGHGMPNSQNNSAYLLPCDGSSSSFNVAIKLDDLYSKLSANPSQGVTVMLDACFSGAARDNDMLAHARSVGIAPDPEELTGNMVVLSAATGKQAAYPYKEKRHGMFTYFLLKKLQETKGDVDYKTLSDYVTENVHQLSSVEQGIKPQTPEVKVSGDIQSSWGEWNFLK